MATKHKVIRKPRPPKRAAKATSKPHHPASAATQAFCADGERALSDAEHTVAALRRAVDDLLTPFECVSREHVFINRKADEATIQRWRAERGGEEYVRENRAHAFEAVHEILSNLRLLEDGLGDARRSFHHAVHGPFPNERVSS